ncbi:hypothetical protein ACFWA1_35885 [Streptomyces sp. NPDC060005]
MDTRTTLLLLVGGLTVYMAFRNPPLGTAIAVATAVVATLYVLIQDSDRQ